MKFIDLFSGIGGFRSALENNGHECLAFAEIDKYARKSYKAIYNTENEEEYHDVTQITDDDFRTFRGRADLIVGGFPCQAFSIAGKRAGFDDTRGTLFFHVARAIKEVQPRFALLENVKGLLSHDKGRTFGVIIQALDEIGYIVEWHVFNSKYWGVPQNRERVFILATRKDAFKEPVLMQLAEEEKEVSAKLYEVLEQNVDDKYYLPEDKIKKMILNDDLSGRLNIYNYRDADTVHSIKKVSPTLNTMQGGDRQPKIAVKTIHDVLENEVDEKYFMKSEKSRQLLEYITSRFPITQRTLVDGTLYNPKPRNIMNTITARYDNGVQNRTSGGGMIIIPVLTPDRMNKRQNGRRFKNNNEPMFTLTAQDIHGIALKQQFDRGTGNIPKAIIDDVYKSRPPRIYKEVAPTLRSENTGLKVAEGFGIRKLTPLECWRLQEFEDEQFYNGVVINPLKNLISYGWHFEQNVHDPNGIARTLKANGGNGNIPKAIIGSTQKNAYIGDGEQSPSLTSAMGSGGGHIPMPVYSQYKIRKLTPLECWRLQGFEDEQFYKAKDAGVSNTQLYKQAGNSVTVNVIDAIVKKIAEVDND